MDVDAENVEERDFSVLGESIFGPQQGKLQKLSKSQEWSCFFWLLSFNKFFLVAVDRLNGIQANIIETLYRFETFRKIRFYIFLWWFTVQYVIKPRAGLKGRGPGQFSLADPYDVIHDVILCKILFRWFATFAFAFSSDRECAYRIYSIVSHLDCKPHEMVLKINTSCPWLQTALEHKLPQPLGYIRDVRVLMRFQFNWQTWHTGA